jgi:hypothetical protein
MKDRSILTDVEVLDLAAAALPVAAFHIAFKGKKYLTRRDPFGYEFLYHKIIHDRRADYCRKGPCRIDIHSGYERSDNPDIAGPFRGCAVYGTGIVEVRPLIPFFKLIAKEHFLWFFASEQQMDLPEITSIVKNIGNQGTKRRKAQTSRNKQ